jgi:CRP/FNR family cyclic AMP-dependent transcriptional regulator
MQTVADLLTGHPFFAGLDEELVRTLGRCCRNVRVPAEGYLFHEGEHADQFFVLRSGRVALDVHVPGRVNEVVATVDAGAVVGWSWFVPPYRWFFDARAVTDVSAVSVDASCLRERCAADPALGFLLMERVAQVMYQRLQSTRLQMLDLYEARRGV